MIKWAIQHLEAESHERHRVRVHLDCSCGVRSSQEILCDCAAGITAAFGPNTIEHALRNHPCAHTEDALLELWA